MDQSHCVNLWLSVPPMWSWHIIFVKCNINVPEIMVWKLVARCFHIITPNLLHGGTVTNLNKPFSSVWHLEMSWPESFETSQLALVKINLLTGNGLPVQQSECQDQRSLRCNVFKLVLLVCYRYNMNIICVTFTSCTEKKLQVAVFYVVCLEYCSADYQLPSKLVHC